MIDREVMTDEERASVQSAVATAAGVDTYNVSITNMKFQPDGSGGIIPERQLNTTMILIVGVSVLAFIIILIIVISLLVKNHKRKKDLMDMVAAGEAQIDDINQYFGPQQPKQDVSVAKLEVTDTKDAALKREIQTFAGENPDIAAQLLRTWLKGEDEDGFY